VEDGQIRSWRYWSLEYGSEATSCGATEQKLAQDLLELLLDATRIRLRSDVPVGAYLSGGLDSTVISALTHLLVGDRLRTFSVSFEDAAFDESRYQREASKFLHTRHSDVCCSYTDIAESFPQVIWHTEQPILRTAPAPLFLLSRLVRESGYKVVLTGEGADEILGGYDIFKEVKIRRFMGQHPESKWRPLLLKRLYPYMDGIQRQPAAYLQHFFHVAEDDLSSPFFSHLPRWELTARLKMLFTAGAHDEMSSGYTDLHDTLPGPFAAWNGFNQAEYLEAMYLLPGYILSSQGDRMAMAHSVEGRYPFLDHRVVSFAAQLPPTLKMKVLDQKHLLKQAARGMIPASIQNRHKQPYRAPDGRSFFTPSPEYVQDMLSEEQIKQDGIFQPASVAALLQKFTNGRAVSERDNMALTSILSTELLLHQFIHERGCFVCKPLSPLTYAISS
jgi:asparagine synthase (glutamine-hydrolysing)